LELVLPVLRPVAYYQVPFAVLPVKPALPVPSLRYSPAGDREHGEGTIMQRRGCLFGWFSTGKSYPPLKLLISLNFIDSGSKSAFNFNGLEGRS
jgi:hypothetical protein